MDEEQDERRHGLVDAQQFIRVSDGLKLAFGDLAAAELGPGARERWQRRLLAITNLAKHDLDRAEGQLQRLRDDLDRELGEDAGQDEPEEGPPPT
jgi:hypothetical protein